ncbi:MAG: CapA family protein [Prochloraceae cyanobacterium]|nr:CapA family protein [Prochloraceae cyanobacterium]
MTERATNLINIFACGDVMTGRGIDCILPHPSNPILYESHIKDARRYLEFAKEVNGPIPKPVNFSYIWGDAIAELSRLSPDLRLINLETSVTQSESYWQGKGINYRMNPENIGCLVAAKIDFCSLANNHVLDWGYSGLAETLATLKKVHIATAGAGHNLEEAETPAVLKIEGQQRAIVLSLGTRGSGIPLIWAASDRKPGVNLKDLSEQTVLDIKTQIEPIKQQKDIVIVSIHWGGNWGYEITSSQRKFARQLIDLAGVDLIVGHSSHHVKGIEVYQGKLILYGCGDFINDYEGIGGYELFRDDLSLMYFLSIDSLTGKLIYLQMLPTQIKRFQVKRASTTDAIWLKDILNREGKNLGTQANLNKDNTLTLKWN